MTDQDPISEEQYQDAISFDAPALTEKNFAPFCHALRRVENSSFFEVSSNALSPYGFFKSRPIIGSSSQINGGIYLSPGKGKEAVVVDTYYKFLRQVFDEFITSTDCSEALEKDDQRKVLTELFNYVLRSIPYIASRLEELHESRTMKQDEKVALDVFIRNGVGAPHHQVLLAAFLVENLIRTGLFNAEVALGYSQTEYCKYSETLYVTLADKSIVSFTPAKCL